MAYRSEIYGNDPKTLLVSPEEVGLRLGSMLSDKVLRFNPYSVDDATLLACVERAVWLPWPSLTQMVVFHFHDIRRIEWCRPYDAIFFHIGNDPRELHLSLNFLTNNLTLTSTLRQTHICVGGNPLTNEKMIERMQGKDYFVSHALPARTVGDISRVAYRMYRLKGRDGQKAALIRERMIDSKITMLNEVLAYPYTPQYLRCCRDFIDYTTPIIALIDAIRRYPPSTNK